MSLFDGVLLIAAFSVAFGLTAWLRAYARRNGLLDVPNPRSAHSIPTPRGGGVAIVIAVLAAFTVLMITGRLPVDAFIAVSGAGALVAAIGFADDQRQGGLPARSRLAGHVVAAGWMLFWMGGPPPLEALGRVVEMGTGGYIVAALFIVWILNLTNFMDGIDGIAAVEAITVALAGAALFAIGGFGESRVIAPLVVAAATAGFLILNWPPASIFMGDAGSGFLGLLLAFFSLQAGTVDSRLFWSWVILLGVFVTDATVTLVRRLIRGQRVYQAHNGHAYQHVARRLGRHRPVTAATALINLCYLYPLALLVSSGRLEPIVGAAIAYVPLTVGALRLGAGRDGR